MDLAPSLKLTPTEQRIYDYLADGEGHTKDELVALLDDDMAGDSAVRFHTYRLRLKLKTIGEDLIFQSQGNRRPVLVRRVKHLLGTSAGT